MPKRLFYVDTCIYLNLWKKEEPFWRSAEKFFNKQQDGCIYYSSFVLKELKHKISYKDFVKKQSVILHNPMFKRVFSDNLLFGLARRIENEIDFEISFFDILHMLLAKKVNAILVTRDIKLLKIAREYNITAKKPEEL